MPTEYKIVDEGTFTKVGDWTKQKIEAQNTELSDKIDKKADKSALDQYFTKTEITEGYATKDDLANLGDLKGACLKSDLDSKKAESKANDMYIVTDDDNHIWYYTGTEFIDTSAVAHVDLSNYYDKGTIDTNLAKKVDKEEGKSLVLDTDITQITTNKTNIETIQSQLEGVEAAMAGLNTRMEKVV